MPVAFGVLLAATLYALCELCSLAAFRLIFREPFSFSAVRRERDERIAAAPARGFRSPRGTSPEVIHPYLGYVRNPAVRLEGVRKANAFGFLGAHSPVYKRSPDRVIVAILGGSVAQKFAMRSGRTLEAELKKDARFAAKDIVLVPLALAGYKEPQQLMTVVYLLSLGAEFDVIVNIDGFNEVALHEAENANQGVFPAFPRGWYARVEGLPSPEERALAGEIAFLRLREVRWARSMPAPLLATSVTANLVWRLRDRQLRAALAKLETALQHHEAPAPAYVGTGPPRPPAVDVYSFLADIWKNSSLQLANIAARNGILYLHFLQPNQYVAGSKPMGEGERRACFDPSHPYRAGVERGYPLLVERGRQLEAAGVRFYDLTRIFATTPEPIYVDTCCHMNHRGNTLLAEHVARAILDAFGREPRRDEDVDAEGAPEQAGPPSAGVSIAEHHRSRPPPL